TPTRNPRSPGRATPRPPGSPVGGDGRCRTGRRIRTCLPWPVTVAGPAAGVRAAHRPVRSIVMTTPVTRGTALSDAWPLPLFLVRTAWGDQPFDELTEYVSGLAEAHPVEVTGAPAGPLARPSPPPGLADAHLVEVTGEPVGPLADASPAAGVASLLPGLVTTLRRAGGRYPAPEVLSLLTAAPGDSSSLPPVPAVRADVSTAGWGLLVRDPDTAQAVLVTCSRAHGGVLRWRARGLVDCPVAPQPDGPSHALAELGGAVIEAAELIERTPARAGSGGPAR